MFDEIIKVVKKAMKRIARVIKEIFQKLRCARDKHDHVIVSWRYTDNKHAIFAFMRCPHCGAVKQKHIYDPREVNRIKKRAGSLRVERWKSA